MSKEIDYDKALLDPTAVFETPEGFRLHRANPVGKHALNGENPVELFACQGCGVRRLNPGQGLEGCPLAEHHAGTVGDCRAFGRAKQLTVLPNCVFGIAVLAPLPCYKRCVLLLGQFNCGF